MLVISATGPAHGAAAPCPWGVETMPMGRSQHFGSFEGNRGMPAGRLESLSFVGTTGQAHGGIASNTGQAHGEQALSHL